MVNKLQATRQELQATNEELESAKEELQSTNEELETVNSELYKKNQQLTKADDDLKNLFAANQAFYRTFKTSPKKTLNQKLFEPGKQQWDIPELRQFLEDIIPMNEHFENYEVEGDFPRLGLRKMSLNARRIEADDEHPAMILLSFKDITQGANG